MVHYLLMMNGFEGNITHRIFCTRRRDTQKHEIFGNYAPKFAPRTGGSMRFYSKEEI
jgi:hypothetical protein